ncbi:MAG TPA: ATP-binding protein [Candidatus Thermoplasmatota archaeon]|nr:ATP-binding protein [Candidatus Thermoplasmatota archaeon]
MKVSTDWPGARYVLAAAATLAGVGVSAFFTFVVDEPLPVRSVLYALPLAGVVFAAYAVGLGPAILSATLASAYAFAHYGSLDEIFPAPTDRIVLGTGVTLITFGIAIVGGYQKRRADRLAREAVEKEHARLLEVERTNKELSELNATLEAFTYVVSHDLKEPVRAIHEYARALHEDHAAGMGEEERELVLRTCDASERLSKLLSGLLEFSRAARIAPHELEAVRVEEALRAPECVARYDNLLQERNARLTVEPGPAVRASVAGLCQSLGNVVLNAVKHNPRPGPVVQIRSATWQEDPDYVEIVVDDNGPGFPEMVVASFNRTRKGRPATLQGGFGLIITREAVEKMGGRMWLERSPLGGARVRFALPAATGPRGPGESLARVAPREGHGRA